jgi:RNA polymerase sigma-70 factor (ECF subfamily)
MEPTPTPATDPVARFEDESVLVQELRAGSEEAYEYLVRHHSGRMLAVLTRMLRNPEEAADALQEAFVQVFRAIDSFEGSSQLGTWLHRIAVNVALMRLRYQRRRPMKSIEDLLPRFKSDGHAEAPVPEWNLTADDLFEQQESREMVRRQIDELPEDYRTVLLLRDIEGLDTEETASVLGITAGAVKTRLHRARQALRALLDPYMRGK